MSVKHREDSITGIRKREALETKAIDAATKTGTDTIELVTTKPVTTGTLVQFKSPCDCIGIDKVKICDKAYSLVDATGKTVAELSGETGGVFVSGAMLSVVIDDVNNKAYLVNGAGAGSGGGSTITVDDALSSTSENPVQNKVIKAALDEKPDFSDIPDIPEIPDVPTVDTVLSLTSENAIANKPVATALCPIDRYNVPLIDGQYGGIEWTNYGNISGVINDITYHDGLFIAVGGSGVIFTSENLSTWTSRDSGRTNILRKVRYCNDRYLAAGSSTLLSSIDGITWELVSSAINFSGVCYGNGRYVAVGYSSAIYTSEDGTTWTGKSSGISSAVFNDVIYANGLFWAVGNSGVIAVSEDGLTWASRETGTTGNIRAITYGKGIYMAVGESCTLAISVDGITWSRISLLGVVANTSKVNLTGVAYEGNQFVAVGGYANYTGKILVSQDGVTWEIKYYSTSVSTAPSITTTGTEYVVVFNNTSSTVVSSSSIFTAEGLALPIPITAYEPNKILNIVSPVAGTNMPLNINSLGAKTINGTVEYGKLYTLIYNGASWDIVSDYAGGSGGGTSIVIDDTPTEGSNNAVSSGGVKTYVDGKFVTLTQAEYDALVEAGTIDENVYYFIKEA